MLDVEQTIISQYANSPTLTQLIENMNEYIDPTADLIQFYNTVWNVDTAEGFGLDIWGRIVGLNTGRVIPIPGTSGSFGFYNSDVPPDWETFGSASQSAAGGPFYGGQSNTGSYTLNDSAFRTLILAKALANISATTSPALNKLIQNLFPGRGRAYVVDNFNMTMTYVFRFQLSTIEYAILAYSGVLPHPGGVGVNISVIPSGRFGFAEADADNTGDVTTWGFGSFYNAPSTGT